MELGLDEAAHKEFGIPFEPQQFKLDRMHQAVKQRSLGDFLVEYDDIKKSQGVHVRKLGKVGETQSPGFGKEWRIGYGRAMKFDYPDAVEEVGRKIRPHQGFLVVAEGSSGAKIMVALLVEIG